MDLRSIKPKILFAFVVAVAIAGVFGMHFLSANGGGFASAQSPQPVGTISRVAPSTPNLTLAVGDTVVLSVSVYGLQNIEDQSLAKDVEFDWSATGGSLPDDADGTSVSYTAPSQPGNYSVTASPTTECVGTATECTATFRISVRQRGKASGPSAPPRNPDGEIPSVLADSEGEQYEVFTPVEGGTFTGEGYWINAPAGIVPNGEIIGVRMYEDGVASNAGMTEDRYTLSGQRYVIAAVDASGNAIDSLKLEGPAQVCIPVPPELRPTITDVGLASINDNGDLTANTSWVRVSPGLVVCGNLSTLPAVIASSIPGSPPPLPTPEPQPEPPLPVTGGAGPMSNLALFWVLVLGVTLISTGVFTTAFRRQ